MRLEGFVFAVIMAAAGFAACNTAHAQGSGSYYEGLITGSVMDWQEKAAPSLQLEARDSGLMGDQIDPHTGSISFAHLDVSLPGNYELAVALTRKNSNGFYGRDNVEFGDWTYEIPRIHAVTASQSPWTGARCSQLQSKFASVQDERPSTEFGGHAPLVEPRTYSNGVMLDVPGRTSAHILKKNFGATFPASAVFVTGDHWYLTCGVASDGGEGFVAHAPNGDKYTFTRVVNYNYDSMGYEGIIDYVGVEITRDHVQIFATEVTDRNGNWVRYSYDAQGRLTRIYASDGREITLGYSGASGLVQSVTANNRTWLYEYRDAAYPSLFDSGIYGPPIGLKTLSKVTLPDGTFWTLTLDGMGARALPGVSCNQLQQVLVIKHPAGISGTFLLGEKRHRVGVTNSPQLSGCFANLPQFLQPQHFHPDAVETMSVISKTLIGPGYPSAQWTYSYEQDVVWPRGSDGFPAPTSLSDPTNWTKILDPSNYETELRHYWNAQGYPGGQLASEEKRVGAGGSTLERRDVLYANTGSPNTNVVPGLDNDLIPLSLRAPVREVQADVYRGQDQYTTTLTYNSDPASTGFSYSLPIKVVNSSSLQVEQRVIDTVFAHDKVKWILGQPLTVTKNGTLFDSVTYDTLSRPLTVSKFGTVRRTYTYNADGTIATYKDSHNHTFAYSSWKRGQPQSILRPDGVTLTRVVDNNGWVTSETDGRAITTGYGYNSLGWLTLIDRPTPFSDSTIVYSGLGSGVVQAETRGARKTTTTYDGMTRPTLVKTEATDGSAATVYLKTGYDGLGRTVFQSWPSTSASPVEGVNTTYDALSRVTSVAENVAPYATTTTAYLSGGQVRVTDPANAAVTTTYRAFGSPDEAEPMSIVDAMGTTTTFTRDIYGNVTTLAQSGTTPVAASVTRQFWYDNSLRLCRHRAPEFGDEVFLYDGEDQLLQSGRGQAAASGCVTSIGTAIRVTRSYDSLHRETSLAFPAGTPGVTRAYDGNGNVTNVTRTGGAVWDYTYTALDAIATEQLAIDGRSYVIGHGYNSNGDLTTRSNSHSGVALDFNANALGQLRRARVGTTDYVTGATYHPNGLLDDATYLNGQLFDQTLNARQLPEQLKTSKPGGATAVWLTHVYDARRKLSSVTDSDGAGDNEGRSFTYDPNGRLLTANGPWGTGSYLYDALGNIRNRTEGTNSVSTMNYNTSNRVSTATIFGQNRTFAYDARGNTTNNGRYAFVYDFANQPTSQTGAVNATFAYDGNFKRVKEVRAGKTIYSVYSRQTGALLYRDQATDVVKTDYVSVGGAALRLKKTGTGPLVPDYTHFDLQGSAVAATDAAGAIAWRESYRPYGRTRLDPSANANNAGYTGHLRDDATGLNYMQARYYDAAIGRFYSTDPIGYQDQLNLYAYVHNDPVNKTDPTGECSGSRIGAGGGSICAGSAKLKESLSTRTSISRTANANGSVTVTRNQTTPDGPLDGGSSSDYGSVKQSPQETAGGDPAPISDAMETRLLDLSNSIDDRTVEVTSGYRSQEAQDRIRAQGNPRAAERSPHTYNDAADIRVPGMSPAALADAAAATGNFARSNTYSNGGDVHVDQNTDAPFQGRVCDYNPC